ncbi:MAG: hypothetical protein ABFE07_29465 [Armatimonadia bacterium]
MPRVFVPEPKNFYLQHRNQVKAERWGKIVPLTPEGSCLGLEPDRIKASVARAVLAFEDEDFILLDGSNAHCAVTASLVAVLHDRLNLLLWDVSNSDYISRSLDLSAIPRAIVSGVPPRVYITNYIHGDSPPGYITIPLTSGNDSDVLEPQLLQGRMLRILVNSQEEDFLVPSGSKTHCVVGSTIMSRMHGRVNYFLWNTSSRQYLPRSCLFSCEDLQKLGSI